MPDPPSLRALTEDVQQGLGELEANLTRSPYKANSVKPLHASVIDLIAVIKQKLSLHPHHPNETAVRRALSSLRSVEGSMQLVITASEEYLAQGNPTEKRKIEVTWINRKTRLAGQADLCAASLEMVLAFADDLDSPASSGESGRGTTAGADLSDDTRNRKRRRPAS
jgi:hypothetical protein